MTSPATASTATGSNNTIYLTTGLISLISAITVATVFYLIFGLTGSIVTIVLYLLALLVIFGWKERILQKICFPRYDNLSQRRKEEVDEMRVKMMKQLLEGLTLTLMIQKKTSTGNLDFSLTSRVTAATVDCCASSASSMEEEDHCYDEYVELGHPPNAFVLNDANHDDDIMPSSTCDENEVAVIVQLYKKEDDEEETTDSSSDSSSSSSVATESDETNEYTHVRIPCPDIMKQRSSSSISGNDTYATCASLASKENIRFSTREISKNCPICLSAYEPGESICYSSSNSECTHVFHSDCIIRWFVEMGRQNKDIVIRHYGAKTLDGSSLLDYTLSCPCCRQPFVQPNEVVPRKGGEENEMKNVNGVVVGKKMEIEMTSKAAETENEDEESPV